LWILGAAVAFLFGTWQRQYGQPLTVMARRSAIDPNLAEYRAWALQHLLRHYSRDDLRQVLFDCGMDPESVHGGTVQEYAMEILMRFERQGNLGDLISRLPR
jgi:hypothetical protein